MSAEIARHSVPESGVPLAPRVWSKSVGRQRAVWREIDRELDQHADAGGGEAVMPAVLLAQRAADQRREERAEIDPDIEDREGAVAPRVAGRIELPTWVDMLGLKAPLPRMSSSERRQEQRLERHHEMAGGHQRLRRG